MVAVRCQVNPVPVLFVVITTYRTYSYRDRAL